MIVEVGELWAGWGGGKAGLKTAGPLQPKKKYLLSAHRDDIELLFEGGLYHVENIGGTIDFSKTLWDSKKYSIELSRKP